MAVSIAIETPLQDDVRGLIDKLNAYLLPLSPPEFQFKLTVEQMADAEKLDHAVYLIRGLYDFALGVLAWRLHQRFAAAQPSTAVLALAEIALIALVLWLLYLPGKDGSWVILAAPLFAEKVVWPFSDGSATSVLMASSSVCASSRRSFATKAIARAYFSIAFMYGVSNAGFGSARI